MELLSINVSEPEEHTFDGNIIRTSIYKKPVSGPLRLDRRRLAGDRQANMKHHGQPFQAVYAYPFEHYAYWQKVFGVTDFPFGQFGENFTTQGLTETDVRIGDIYRVGDALLQVTFLRIPCGVFALKMKSASFVNQFRESLRTGFYMSVLRPGQVDNGSIELMETNPEHITVADLARAYFNPEDNREILEKSLSMTGLADEVRHMIVNKMKAASS